MPKISQQQEQRLRNAGLYLSFFPDGHKGFPNGIRLFKPIELKGNRVADYDTTLSSVDESGNFVDVVKADAPPIVIGCSEDRIWYLHNSQFCPGPGPGDFFNQYDNEEQAVDDALKFYFDTQDERMKPYAEHYAQNRARRMADKDAPPKP